MKAVKTKGEALFGRDWVAFTGATLFSFPSMMVLRRLRDDSSSRARDEQMSDGVFHFDTLTNK